MDGGTDTAQPQGRLWPAARCAARAFQRGSNQWLTATFAMINLWNRILGSRAEAEDAVQDTFVKWSQADSGATANPVGWLARTTRSRRSLDRGVVIDAGLPHPASTLNHKTDAAEIQKRFTSGLNRSSPLTQPSCLAGPATADRDWGHRHRAAFLRPAFPALRP